MIDYLTLNGDCRENFVSLLFCALFSQGSYEELAGPYGLKAVDWN